MILIIMFFLIVSSKATAEQNIHFYIAAHFHQKYSDSNVSLSHFIQDFDRVSMSCFKNNECASKKWVAPLHNLVREFIDVGDRRHAVIAARFFAVLMMRNEYDFKN